MSYPAVPVDLQFPVSVIGNAVVQSLLVDLRRVPAVGESIDFHEDAGIDPRLDGRSFTVKGVAWPITQRAPGVNMPPQVILRSGPVRGDDAPPVVCGGTTGFGCPGCTCGEHPPRGLASPHCPVHGSQR